LGGKAAVASFAIATRGRSVCIPMFVSTPQSNRMTAPRWLTPARQRLRHSLASGSSFVLVVMPAARGSGEHGWKSNRSRRICPAQKCLQGQFD
jgi:hypothetical protein